MDITLDTPFTYHDQRYETHATVTDHDIRFVTSLYPIGYQTGDQTIDTRNTENWPAFYKLGWTKPELYTGIRDEWTLTGIEWRNTLIDYYETRLVNATDGSEPIPTEFFDFHEWRALPTPEVFDQWLPQFIDQWNHTIPHDPNRWPEQEQQLEALLDQLNQLLYDPANCGWDGIRENLMDQPFDVWVRGQIGVWLASQSGTMPVGDLVNQACTSVSTKFHAILATPDLTATYAHRHAREYEAFAASQSAISNTPLPELETNPATALDVWLTRRISQSLYHCPIIERRQTRDKPLTLDQKAHDLLNNQLDTELAWAIREHKAARIGTYWERITSELTRIRTSKPDTASMVITIVNEEDPHHTLNRTADHAFFGGGGGDETLLAALQEAGWHVSARQSSYHYLCEHPNTGELLYYCEGDVYGNQQARQKMAALPEIPVVPHTEAYASIQAACGTPPPAPEIIAMLTDRAYEHVPERGGWVKILSDTALTHLIDTARRDLPELWEKVDLILGSQKNCGKCRFVRRWLDNHGITYREIDLKDPANTQWLTSLSQSGLPMETPVIYDGASGHPIMSGSPDMHRLAQLAPTRSREKRHQTR